MWGVAIYRADRSPWHRASGTLSRPSSNDAARTHVGRRRSETATTSSFDRQSAWPRAVGQQVRSSPAHPATSQDRQTSRRRAGLLPRCSVAARSQHHHAAAARRTTALWNVQELVALADQSSSSSSDDDDDQQPMMISRPPTCSVYSGLASQVKRLHSNQC